MDAIVLTSFGVAGALARERSIDSVAEALRASFPDFLVVQAYTSSFIKKRLAAEGIFIPSLPEALAELEAKGYERVIIQPTHLTPGEEYSNKILAVADEWRERFAMLVVGSPVFTEARDYGRVLRAVLPSLALEPGEELVLIGHGSPHQHNPVYEELQQVADTMGLPLTLGVLEPTDTPDFGAVLERLRARDVARVLLAPLLLAGGRHVTRDIAGAESSSWLSRLTAAGFSVRTDTRGLGELAAFREHYVYKVRQSVAKLTPAQ